jgi:hypothetical protein
LRHPKTTLQQADLRAVQARPLGDLNLGEVRPAMPVKQGFGETRGDASGFSRSDRLRFMADLWIAARQGQRGDSGTRTGRDGQFSEARGKKRLPDQRGSTLSPCGLCPGPRTAPDESDPAGHFFFAAASS